MNKKLLLLLLVLLAPIFVNSAYAGHSGIFFEISTEVDVIGYVGKRPDGVSTNLPGLLLLDRGASSNRYSVYDSKPGQYMVYHLLEKDTFSTICALIIVPRPWGISPDQQSLSVKNMHKIYQCQVDRLTDSVVIR